MIYFSVRDDLRHMRSLLHYFEEIISIEQETRQKLRESGTQYLGPYEMFRRIREESSSSNPDYSSLRTEYAKMIPRANEICNHEGISWHIKGRAAPLEGGLPFQGSIFELILNRPSDLMDLNTDLRDTANQCIGVLERRMSHELRQLINPFYWISRMVIFIVRLPYSILKLSGFDVEQIQEHLIARLFQLLYIIALILILVRFGLASAVDLKSLLLP